MRRSLALFLVALAFLMTSCAGLSVGREFPSPAPDMLRVGQTSKADLLRSFGEPTEVGLDTGDQTWTWLYGRINQQTRKQLTVRFDDRGMVRSYSFTSSLPEDMKRLK